MAGRDRPLQESPSQTAGPYLHIGCLPNYSGIDGVYAQDPGNCLLSEATRGERISVRGRVFDGEGEPLLDAMLEIWQADAAGLYPSPVETRGEADTAFHGWGRQPSDPQNGEFRFETIKPGRVPYPDGRLQAPHITVWIVARGINIGLHTRLYFDDEPEANAADPILLLLDPGQRRDSLIAVSEGDGVYRFDVNLQGEAETVFFDM